MNGLYLVTPNWDDTARLLDKTEQALIGGAALVQYRHKTAAPKLREEQAGLLLALCRRYARPCIINDHLDLCMALKADGIHLGGTDLSVEQARLRLGPDKLIGASCYGELALAQAAQNAGASYVAFGGFYPSQVKVYPVTTASTILQQARQCCSLPQIVIGGMTVDNAPPLVAMGADMVAAISSVYMAQDSAAAARAFVQLFEVRVNT
jgi:thiamine-phosphate pyrophosphorylase